MPKDFLTNAVQPPHPQKRPQPAAAQSKGNSIQPLRTAAEALQRAVAPGAGLASLQPSAGSMLALQRLVGNRAAQRLVEYSPPPEALFRAFTDPTALAVWLSPGEMTGEVPSFDFRVGGGYRMLPYYPLSDEAFCGMTSEREDRFTASALW